jgi:2-polyprenyl-3-methyl-5-hydroxy-6-metoxy-1,4-benzoquinol methylase
MMSTEKGDYDQAYQKDAALFGDASPLIARFAGQIEAGSPVLDIGIGQGRNSLPLAAAGHPITGVDPSHQALVGARAAANARGIATPIELLAEPIEALDLPECRFGAVLVFGLFQIQTRAQIESLLVNCRRWLKSSGLLFITCWQTGDSALRQLSCDPVWDEITPNSFRRDDEVRTFLAPNEITAMLPEVELLHHREGHGPWHRHGDGPAERHFDIEVVGRLAVG